MKPPHAEWRRLHTAVRQVLIEVWDPIHVRDVPEAQDEYDVYAFQICGMLRRHATKQDLAARILAFETDWMGLAETDAARTHADQLADRLLKVAGSLA